MENINQISTPFVLAHMAVVIGLSIRVIMQRKPPGASLAWLILIVILPLAGAGLYLLIGERPLGKIRAKRAVKLLDRYQNWLRMLPPKIHVDWSTLSPASRAINRLIESTIGTPAMAGNALHLLDDAESILQTFIADINGAQHTCDMEFYIWSRGGRADEVCEALIRAAKRGVTCRVLVDAVGSADFLKSTLARRLQKNGIELNAALKVGLLRMAFVRLDLRLHRKIVVIDNRVAYTGSLNLVDPRFFKRDAGVGQWVDAMVRIEGPAVQVLRGIFSWDWEVETGQGLKALEDNRDLQTLPKAGTANVQVVPSGPGYVGDAIHQLVLAAIYAARAELIITTPYFVPDESLLTALLSAAGRGVNITIIMPEKIDSVLVRYACGSYFDELLAAGVHILRFKGGLLHTKSINVDGEIVLFGTINLDIRSFKLNFEVTLCAYDRVFGAQLRMLQLKYIEKSDAIDLGTWRKRPKRVRFAENVARLFSPLL